MHMLPLLLICAFICSSADHCTRRLRRLAPGDGDPGWRHGWMSTLVKDRIDKVANTLPKFMDTNCDGIVNHSEVVNSTAHTLGHDPVRMQKRWDQYAASLHSKCYGHVPNSSSMVYALSEAFMYLGRVDRTPCNLIGILEAVGRSLGFDAEAYLKETWDLVKLSCFFEVFYDVVTFTEDAFFENWIDLNKDGCLDEDEWKAWMQWHTEILEANYSVQKVVATEFSTIEEHRPPNGSVMQSFYAEQCVTKFRFAIWSLFALLDVLEKFNEPAPCYKSEQLNIKVTRKKEGKKPSDQQQGLVDSVIILVGILGVSGIVCLGICIIWCLRKYRRKRIKELHQKEVMVGTEIDSWSVFDHTLTGMTSSLKPSFVQMLGLANFQEAQLSLLQIVHPEDHPILHAALAQCKSEPTTKQLRLQCGVSRVPTGEASLSQDDVKYISVQTTLVWRSESIIHVGLSPLSKDGSTKSTCLDPAVVGNHTLSMSDETSNDQAQNTNATSVVTEQVFKTVEMKQIALLGFEEHWVIPSDSITFDNATAQKGGFGMVHRGLLLGSAEVAVKMALTDESEERVASKCKALANEVRLFRRIRHPNIVQFHGVLLNGRLDDATMQLGVVLEWISGGNLEQHCKTQHRIGAYDINRLKTAEGQLIFMSDCGLLVDVTRGMLYLHALRPVILHRDLKPANILVDKVSTPPRAKLTDFGLSTLIEHSEHPKKRAGTEAYMAPEIKKGEPYSTMVDVFSFGCIVFFVVSGHHPKKDQDSDLLGQGLAELKDAFSFGDHCLSIKQWLDSLISAACQCLNTSPTLRPTFVDLFTLLSKHLHSDGSSMVTTL